MEDMKEIQDPFFEAKENVVLKLSDVCRLHDLYLKMQKERCVESSMALADVMKEFREMVDDIDNDLVDLEEVVCVVENQPEKYGISNEESLKRRAFVDQVRSNLVQIQKDLENPSSDPLDLKNKACSQNSSLLPEKPLRRDSVSNIELAQEYQSLIMNEQDTQLDYVFGTVQNLREQASIMGRELVEQSELIEEVDMRIERTNEKLKRGFKNMKRIVAQNEG
ncbi:uncharacterized protein T551_01251 [Pneumocystis jirovecii RU7]|uniref:t-SNARE affecting a late Golgi compartment protein 1 n=1 Tax=Pneumocystis jirovecii (strain RU7) TaxID=1408657 RepID=A0A0W4ZS20_PNEJ7|nr:uncharacterized protein T551_01251 [Pneumocystis jirovecii RU7]KTW31178.1 hypothetical protein T551_01251 [Pneumocystis jirovecii RU7]